MNNFKEIADKQDLTAVQLQIAFYNSLVYHRIQRKQISNNRLMTVNTGVLDFITNRKANEWKSMTARSISQYPNIKGQMQVMHAHCGVSQRWDLHFPAHPKWQPIQKLWLMG